MSDFIRVFCRSCPEISATDVAEFIEEGVYFQHTPEIRVNGQGGSHDWKQLEIEYQPDRRPITIWHDAGSELLRTEIAEITEELQDQDLGSEGTDVLRRLAEVSCVYAIEIGGSGLSDDARAMLDSLEAHIARLCDGLVYAPGDGFFDASLTRLCSVGGKP